MAASTSYLERQVQPNLSLATEPLHRDSAPAVSHEQFTLFTLSSENIGTKQGKDLAKVIKNQLREWQSVAYTRIALLRQKITASPNEVRPQLQEQLAHDMLITDEGYTQLRQFVALHLDELAKEANCPRKIVVLTDSSQQMQGVLSVTINTDYVYVNTLLSGPWNNSSMNSPLPLEYKPLVKRGVGKVLMTESYKIAQTYQKSRIELLPLADSESFYQHIGMEKRGSPYVLDVSPYIPKGISVPTIQVVQGNLL
jgi:hypothetical protein